MEIFVAFYVHVRRCYLSWHWKHGRTAIHIMSFAPWQSFRLLKSDVSSFTRCFSLAVSQVFRLPYNADSVMVGRAVPKQVRAVSLMIWFLSKSSDLGMAYVLSRGQEYDLGDVDLYSRAAVALFMVSWLADQSVRHSLHAGLTSLDDKGRMVADQFLLHSMLMEFIVAQNRKGVALDLTSLIAKYIRLWTYRPIPNVIKRRLAKLVWHRGTRRRFGVNLRREWGLCFNRFEDVRELTKTQIMEKVKYTCNNINIVVDSTLLFAFVFLLFNAVC